MSKFKGKKVLVVGLGVSGLAAAKYLTKQGAKVTVTDLKQRSELADKVNQCEALKIEFELGRHNSKTFTSNELVVLSPGIPPETKPLDEVKAAGIPLTSEFEIAAHALKEPLIAITGTNGKTTTTVLLGEMFKADGKAAFVGGNLGRPILDYINDGGGAQYVIGEVSSFQLDLADRFTPAAAVFTNIEPDHLDRYQTFEAYVQSKRKLLRACDRNTFVILNYDNPTTQVFGNESNAKVIWFTRRNPMQISPAFSEKFWGCYYDQPRKRIVAKLTGREEVYDVSQFRLLGDHNVENLMAAICTARSFGVQAASIQKVIQDFKGVEHRLEFVRKKDGVYFFNDSKGTNVMSVTRSLAAFQHSPVILIAGGKDKGGDFGVLTDLVRKKCKMLILIGEAKEKINRALGDYVETYLVGTFDEAVLVAYQKSRRGDIILLSPGCSSFDMFRNYEERGEYFKKLVHQL